MIGMARRLLVPLTDSKHSWPGLQHALELFPNADITVLNVVDPVGAGYGERSEGAASGDRPNSAEEQAEALFEAAHELAREYGTALDTAVVEGRPAETIVEFAEEQSIEQIIMGSRGRSGVSRVLLGSVAVTVVENASIPVTVVP